MCVYFLDGFCSFLVFVICFFYVLYFLCCLRFFYGEVEYLEVLNFLDNLGMILVEKEKEYMIKLGWYSRLDNVNMGWICFMDWIFVWNFFVCNFVVLGVWVGLVFK